MELERVRRIFGRSMRRYGWETEQNSVMEFGGQENGGDGRGQAVEQWRNSVIRYSA